jgi:hypothetical protein
MRRTRANSPLVPRPDSRRVGFIALSVVLLLLLAVSSAEAQFNTGDVLAGVGSGKIKRFTPAGTLQQTLDSTTGSSETTGMCFDGSGNLFATMFSVSQVSKFSNTGALVAATFGSGYNADPESCVFQGVNILVGQADGLRKVRKLDPTGTLITEFAPAVGPRGTDFIDLASDQCTLHYTSEGTVIKTFNVCTNTQGPDFATGLTGGACYAHRIRPNGEELVACTSVAHRISSAGAILQTYSAFSPAPSTLFALNLDPDGTTFWTGGLGNGQVYRMNIATGAQVTSWNAGAFVDMAGLAVVGEIVVSQPTPTPGGGQPAAVVPTLSFPMLGLLCAALLAAALLLIRR